MYLLLFIGKIKLLSVQSLKMYFNIKSPPAIICGVNAAI